MPQAKGVGVSKGHLAKPDLTTIRGIACLALVAHHVIGPTANNGMHLPEGSYWHLAMNSMDFLRMPLFTVVSGYLYGRRRVDRAQIGAFFRKKGRRLLAPLLFVTAVMLGLRDHFYGATTSLTDAFLFSYQHLWFLQSLLLIFAVIAVWDAFARPNWVQMVIVAFGAVMIARSFSITDFLSIGGALYLAPFFLFGMILRIEPAILEKREMSVLAGWLVAIVLIIHGAGMAHEAMVISRTSVPAALCGLSAAYLLMSSGIRVPVMAFIGQYSFTIYLWHSIAAAAVRNALAGVALPVGIAFVLLMLVGIFVPILIHLVVERIPGFSIIAAGITTRGDAGRMLVREPTAAAPPPAAPSVTDVAAMSNGQPAIARTTRLRTSSDAVFEDAEAAAHRF